MPRSTRRATESRRPLLAVEAHAVASRVAQLAGGGAVVHLTLAELDGAVFARLAPGRVACPLIAAGFDALDLVARLVGLGYRARMTVLCPPLPNRALVLRELRAAGPRLRIDLVEPGRTDGA